MPQNTPAQARVIDPVLTTVARGYQQPDAVGMALFPYVPVGQRGGKIIQFGREHFRLYNTARAPGSKVARLLSSYGSQAYALESHALEEPVPDELSQEAAAVPGLDLGKAATRRVQSAIGMRLEYAQAVLATNAANYAASNKVTLAGTAQWSDLTTGVSDPVKDVEAAKEAVRGQIGKRPNTVVMGAKVFASVKQHPKIVDRLKYTQREIATPELLASLFDVERVLVGDAVYVDDAGVMNDIWGKFCVLAYTDIAPVNDASTPSYGYTYRLGGYPTVSMPYYENSVLSWVYQVLDEVSPVIAGAEAGYLISAAVA
jgi:Phage major capsid protein E